MIGGVMWIGVACSAVGVAVAFLAYVVVGGVAGAVLGLSSFAVVTVVVDHLVYAVPAAVRRRRSRRGAGS